jgi:hypothetical protein
MWIMETVKKSVAAYIPLAHMHAIRNVTATIAHHVRPLVMYSVVTPGALRNAPSHVAHVQYQYAYLPVRIVRVPCLALHHVITFHALGDVRSFYRAATNAHHCVVSSVHRKDSVKHVRPTT